MKISLIIILALCSTLAALTRAVQDETTRPLCFTQVLEQDSKWYCEAEFEACVAVDPCATALNDTFLTSDMRSPDLLTFAAVDVLTEGLGNCMGVLCEVEDLVYQYTTIYPTRNPTANPSISPTGVPTVAPTSEPTMNPRVLPTEGPSVGPTSEPTGAPTGVPTDLPTTAPATSFTEAPTEAPTAAPATVPTSAPTTVPTPSPTTSPMASPTASPIATTPSPTFAPFDAACIRAIIVDRDPECLTLLVVCEGDPTCGAALVVLGDGGETKEDLQTFIEDGGGEAASLAGCVSQACGYVYDTIYFLESDGGGRRGVGSTAALYLVTVAIMLF